MFPRVWLADGLTEKDSLNEKAKLDLDTAAISSVVAWNRDTGERENWYLYTKFCDL